mmetsp:Transcript_81399/g.212225  ORF Transcript_81399/g.212225 Transcript_81399/m.212225 type:complete len:84 (+) Transcript_81399:240-491(+)
MVQERGQEAAIAQKCSAGIYKLRAAADKYSFRDEGDWVAAMVKPRDAIEVLKDVARSCADVQDRQFECDAEDDDQSGAQPLGG